MIAYNHKSLDAAAINDAASEAARRRLISNEEQTAIKNAYPDVLYTPNVFIRIGLFLLTSVIVFMGFGLYFLFVGSLGQGLGFGILTAVFALLVYAALELMVSKNGHFRSGVDDALLWLSGGFMVAAVNILPLHLSYFDQAVMVLILFVYLTLRFGNRLMAGLAFISFLAVLFFGVMKVGEAAKMLMPFILLAVSVAVYVLSAKNSDKSAFFHYARCLTFIRMMSLMTAYAAVNYFVVRELSNEMFGLHLHDGDTIPGGWFFWGATAVVPVMYLLRGIQRRDVLLLRLGLLLIAAAIFTIRYYYHIASIEAAMTTGGTVMILIAYAVSRYLATPKHGITNAEANDPQLFGVQQIESLMVAETFHQSPDPGTHVDFGGGSSGGGGATGQY